MKCPLKPPTFDLQLGFTLRRSIFIDDLTGVNARVRPHSRLDRHLKCSVYFLTHDMAWPGFYGDSVPQPTHG